MALGFLLIDGITYARPDRTLNRESTFDIHLAKFGDGYEQRLAKGINNIKETFSISFNNRTKEEIDNIVALLKSKAGATGFDFTIPDSNEVGDELTIKVVCESVNTTYNNCDYYNCNATFRRVYEA